MIKKLLFCEGQYCFINDVDIPFIPILTLYRKKSVFSYLASLRDTPHTPTNPYYHLFTNSEEKIVSNSFDFLSSLLHWVQNRWNFRAIFIRSKDSTFFLSFKFEDSTNSEDISFVDYTTQNIGWKSAEKLRRHFAFSS